ncbi:MAG TPA: Do family serine endopeptidase, partial [Saprospiraceae bacterium]|nr:Do family serine endopeptidase [Saprospiraceae bacterium]
ASYENSGDWVTASPLPPASGFAPTDFISAAEAVTPAVVNIKASQPGDYFWGGQGGYGASTGSGVIISPEGLIVTNRHVIEDGNKIEVTLSDKREFEAEIVGNDPSTDLALLKIKAKNLPSIKFGNSDNVRVGEWVLAVGNPFNLESTVTAGIVSAKGRNIDILEDQYSIESFIQTDAAVNPGNSGGALVNTSGELIGINTAIITRSGRYEGYSFAVPSNLVQKIISDIQEFGEVQRAILGVNIEPVDNARAKELGLKNVEGVFISRVSPSGGADEGGLRAGDVIVNINNAKIRTMPELQEQIGRYRPGNIVTVQFYRNGKLQETKVTLRNKNNSLAMAATHTDDMLLELGFELRDLLPSEERRAKVKGVKVISIYRGSKIERTAMDPDYIITKVNDVRVTSVDEAIEQLKKAKGRVLLEGYYENYPGEYYYTFAK